MVKTTGRRLAGFRLLALALVMLALTGFILAVHASAVEPTQTPDGTDTSTPADGGVESPGTTDSPTADVPDGGTDDAAEGGIDEASTEGTDEEADEGDEGDGVGHTAITAYIAASFADLGVTPADIDAIFQQGYGFGEIVIALSIARESGQPLDEVIALAAQGLEWKDVAASLGITMEPFGRYVSAVMAGPVKLGDKPGAKVRKQYDEAALLDLLETVGIDGEAALEIVGGYGFEVREVVIAATVAVLSGDAANFELALQMRVEQRSWEEVFSAIGVEPKGTLTKPFANIHHLEAKLRAAAHKAADRVKGGQGKPDVAGAKADKREDKADKPGKSDGAKAGGKK